MQKTVLAACLLLAALSVPAKAHAVQQGPFSAADLKAMCTSTSDVDYGYCAGYVSAIANTLLTQPVGGFRACHQAQVRSQQFVDTFNSWAELFPEKLGMDADAAVASSLARAFPCQ